MLRCSYCFELLDTSIYVYLYSDGRVKQTAHIHVLLEARSPELSSLSHIVGLWVSVRASLLVQNALHINKLERKIVFQFILCEVENIFCANLACFSFKIDRNQDGNEPDGFLV